MRVFGYLVILILSLALPHAAFGQQLKWEVVQPFRFLRFESDHRIHELAYKEASSRPNFKNRPVSSMEALLNDPVWWETTLPDYKSSPIDIIARMKNEENRSPERFDARKGWSSLLRSEANRPVFEATCWDAKSQSFDGCLSEPAGITGGKYYVFPKHHIIRAWIENTDGKRVQGVPCSFRIVSELDSGYGILENNKYSKSKELAELTVENCTDEVFIRVKYGDPIVLEASLGDVQAVEPIIINVRDIAIASMGDSFGSGEGNPDHPALLDPDRVVRPHYKDDPKGTPQIKFGVPRRKSRPDGKIAKRSSARWLDRRCHRSMYSSHTRAAITLALTGDRHHAVTYVSAACSGAEVTDGMFWPQDGRECTTDRGAGTRFLQPQFSALVGTFGTTKRYENFDNTLDENDHFRETHLTGESYSTIRKRNSFCRSWPGVNHVRSRPFLRVARLKREIDLLLVSIGGNDMGFAPLVTSLVVTRGPTNSIISDAMVPVYRLAAGGISIDEAKNRLGYLDERFEMFNLGVRKKLEIKDGKKVLLSVYPTPAFASKNVFCDSGRKGMNVAKMFNLAGPDEKRTLVNIRQAQEIVEQLNTQLKSYAKKYQYNLVDSFESRFFEHGMCAEDKNSKATAEIHGVPYKYKDSKNWKLYDPTQEFFPYAKRQRWFRSFVDSFLLTQHFKEDAYENKATDKEDSIYFALRSLGGPVHPTAEGHAAVADAIVCKAKRVLFEDRSDIQCD